MASGFSRLNPSSSVNHQSIPEFSLLCTRGSPMGFTESTSSQPIPEFHSETAVPEKQSNLERVSVCYGFKFYFVISCFINNMMLQTDQIKQFCLLLYMYMLLLVYGSPGYKKAMFDVRLVTNSSYSTIHLSRTQWICIMPCLRKQVQHVLLLKPGSSVQRPLLYPRNLC